MDSLVIDAFEFSRLKELAVGTIPVADLVRLSQECVGAAGSIDWSVQGGVDLLGHPGLKVSVSGELQLICQRCLGPLPFTIKTESFIVLAVDEDQADALESMVGDEEIDIIVGSQAFDVHYLVEDEALLALPLAPKHQICPVDQDVGVDVVSEDASPFAILKNLQK
ncbi:YceD family protein [Herbaspirillum sp. RTI4]|uniref:YceD family protein n=1 Tax=Herbaspirillum sp. RTI4 TaxID=3048640 RepID=UPI002AB40D46|nr:YceD family protein [Herbaspirillum sp. RTI4]MDY7578485.1 YceD family protein [Herbaspirillum sp. RTI4]MEA9981486.1 YceD family protein [Herbaspirillum sp. RTI4]